MATAEFTYEAFISYSHADETWARWLHRAIETYRIPKRVIAERGDLPVRLAPIFRDRDELPTAVDLGRKIDEALRASRRMIVVCSPSAAGSRWVNEEIRRFKALGGAERIFAIIVAGEPNAVERGRDAALECFPMELRLSGQEHIAADVRPQGDGRRNAQLKLIAGMVGVGLDDLKRRDQQRRHRRMVAVTIVSVSGLVLTSALAAFALVARRDAEREAQTSRRTTDFMVQLFNVVDPGEARGRSVTAYEILEKGVDQIHQLNDAPEVQATLLRTMGKVFTGLGLYDKAAGLLTESLDDRASGSSVGDEEMGARVALAHAQYMAGKYDIAEAQYRDVLAALPSGSGWDALHSDAFDGLAEVLTQKGNYDEAFALYDVALPRDRTLWGESSERTAATLDGLASAQFFAKKFGLAKVNFEAALAAYRASLGEDHPRVADEINNLAAVYYASGDVTVAAGYYAKTLPLYRKLYGDRHPSVATVLNNLARMELELGKVDDAKALLEESVAIDRELGREAHDDFVFGLSNLAIADKSRGDLQRAEALLNEARVLAESMKHRLWAPILVDLADVYCNTQRISEGAALVAEARPMMAAVYSEEPWHMLLLDSVDGGCRSAAGDGESAERTLLESYSQIRARWGDAGVFTHDARARIARHYERTAQPQKAARYRVAEGARRSS